MAKYLILIYEDEKAYIDPSPNVWQTAMEAHTRFAGQVGRRAVSCWAARPSSRRPPPPRSAATWSPLLSRDQGGAGAAPT